MKSRLRGVATCTVAVVALGTLSGCGEREDKIEEVRAAVAATRRVATQFIYTDERTASSTTVAGAIEDDFRFKAVVSHDAQPAYEEIVYDDLLALRFHDSSAIPNLVDPTRIDTADTSTELTGVTVIQALQSRRWVVDGQGAPPVTAYGAAATDIGADPVFDAITSLRYVETALAEAFSVDEWRADALSPTYPKSEDVFPQPEDGSGVTRYDLRRLFLPAAGDAGGAGGQRSLASTKNFRKMAIYVKGGRIIRVVERVEITGRLVETVVDYVRALLEESRAPENLVQRFERMLASYEGDVLGGELMEFLNDLLARLGVPPVMARIMSLEFEPGEGGATIALPTDDVVKGSLEVMLASRQAKAGTDADPTAGDSDEEGGEPTTTLPADPSATTTTGGDGGSPEGDGESPPTTTPDDSSTSSLPIIPA